MLGNGVQSGKGRFKRPGGIQVGVLDMPGEGTFMSKCSLSHVMSSVPTCTIIMAF